ncbi:hypothetical protein AAFC00_006536 [Neodothiora populina]
MTTRSDARRQHDQQRQQQYRNSQQATTDEMDDAHVDAARLIGKLRAALQNNPNNQNNHDDDNDDDLPPLPSDDEDEDSFLRSNASFLDTDRDDQLRSDAGHSTVDERELRRHLMDVESSFLPDVAPYAPAEGRVGADDTYVNLGSPDDRPPVSNILGLPLDESTASTAGKGMRNSRQQLREHSGDEEEDHDESINSHHDGRESYRSHNSTTDEDDEMSATDIQPSSPAAAAAQRTHGRTHSHNDRTIYQYEGENGDVSPRRRSISSPMVPDLSVASPQPQDIGLPPSERGSLLTLNSVHSLSPSRLAKRPNYFSSRSLLSSHSFAGESVISPDDSGLDADYALQTGGAIPSNVDRSAQSHGSTNALSRLPSFGSVVSAVSRESNDEKPMFNRGVSGISVLASLRSDRQLDRLEEEDRSSVLSDPMTPRPQTAYAFAAPTDTVIAQHVQNIQVPDTIAREYHQRNGSISPDKSRPESASTITFQGARPRSSNLTLKEQNSKIDKLTKENFDLKLKIHFLDQALQNRSDEGVKDMINKNVQFQTDLANERKENQSLRRHVRELERKFREKEEELAEAKKSAEEAAAAGSNEELEYEITQLSEEVDRCQIKITRLSADNMAKDIEKRKLAEHISALTSKKGHEMSAAEEESEMWKDLLTTETARREQAEDDARKLREELVLLRSEKASEAASKTFGNHLRRQQRFDSRSVSRDSSDTQERGGANSSSSVTLVEQLRHENAELRRDLGAQTSMLTSRNKERERLQQEIEDLKLLSRRGDGSRSIAGDSILDRSISRQHQRATSRASGQTMTTHMSDTERDEWERREGALRDQNAALRMDYQELEREFMARNGYVDELENEVETLENTYDSAVQDLQALQKERDAALQALDDREREAANLKVQYEKLKDEAVTAINELEGDLDAREEEAKRFASDLKDREDDFIALQRELRDLNNSLMQLEDDRAVALKKIEALEQELDEATQELEAQDKKLRETTQKNERLEVQHESLHSEISFLREEQEGDKIKIGDLENSLNAAQQSINDEREKMQEIEESLVEERRQREIVDNQSKQEVQKVLNDLNVENSKSKDEVRRLRRALSSKEIEATSFKKSLDEIESNLRRALGDFNGKRTGWFIEIERLQNDLDATMDELEKTRGVLSERERVLRDRDALLESTGLESRRLNDLLDKEREARRRDLHQYEMSQRGHSLSSRQTAQHESRLLELETARTQDRRKMAMLEQQYRDQLIDRNNLLLALWNRLSTLCGVEWAQNHGLINGEVPSVDVIARSFQGFNRNIVDAVRTIESLMGSFKQRIRGIEKTFAKDYQTLSINLDGRIKRMDFLERAVKDAQDQIEEQGREQAHLRLQQNTNRSSTKSLEEIGKLKQEIKVLKTEVRFYKQSAPQQQQQQQQGSNSSVSEGVTRRGSGTSMLHPRNIANSLMRHHSTNAVEQLQNQPNSSRQQPIVIATPPIQPSEQRLAHRLKEMERRLKAEREGRLLDRRGARQRLEEMNAEVEELNLQLDREKERRESISYNNDDDEDRESVVRGRNRGRDGSVD